MLTISGNDFNKLFIHSYKFDNNDNRFYITNVQLSTLDLKDDITKITYIVNIDNSSIDLGKIEQEIDSILLLEKRELAIKKLIQ